MRSTVAAALLGGLLLAGASPASAQEGPAPLPPDPPAKIKKAIESALAAWFKNEPSLPPPRGKTAIDLKSDRNKATGDLENAVKEWYAANKPGPGARGLDPLRKVLWWRDAMAKVPIEEAAKTGTQKQEIAITEMQWKFNVITMVPKSYRPRQSEQYPLVVTVVDKEADAKLMDRHYGDLANTHIVIALRDEEVKSPAHFFFALAWASLTHRIDRDRVTLDGIGRGSKWIDDVAPQLALQFNGAVFRAPLKTHPSVANLGHFPCFAFQRTPSTDTTLAAVEAIRKASPRPEIREVAGEPDEAALKAVQAWIAALPKRTINDQTRPFSFTSQRLQGFGRWGYWILLGDAVESGQVTVSVDRVPEENAVNIVARNLASGSLLLNDEILDLDRPVKVIVNGIQVVEAIPTRGLQTTFAYNTGLAKEMLGPRDYFITAELPFEVTGEARLTEAERKAAAEAAAAAEARAIQWKASWSDAVEASKTENRPIFAVFDGAAGDAQSNLEASVARADVQDAVREFVCVRLPVEGDANTANAEILAKLLAEAKAPHAFLLSVGGEKVEVSLSVASIADFDAFVKALIEALRPFLRAGNGDGAPEDPNAPAPAAAESAPVTWHPDLPAAESAAAEGKLPLFVAFDGAADAAGQKEFDEAIARPEVRALLSKFACVRLQAHGRAGGEHLARLEKVSPGAKTPHALARAAGAASESLFAPAGEGDALAKSMVEFLEKALGKPAEPAPAPPAPPAPPTEGETPKPDDAGK